MGTLKREYKGCKGYQEGGTRGGENTGTEWSQKQRKRVFQEEEVIHKIKDSREAK